MALSATAGDIVARIDFGGKHIIDQVIGVGLAAHEGQLFGPLNQALGVLTALGLITLCASAFVMWRRRSPAGVLGAPPPIPDARIGAGLAVMILVAAVLLPVLGASLVILAVIERVPAQCRLRGDGSVWRTRDIAPLTEPRGLTMRF